MSELAFTTAALSPNQRDVALRGFVESAFSGMRVLDVAPEIETSVRVAPLSTGRVLEIETSPKRSATLRAGTLRARSIS